MIWIKKNKNFFLALLLAGLFFLLGLWTSPNVPIFKKEVETHDLKKDSLKIEIAVLNVEIDSLRELNSRNYQNWIKSKNRYYVLNKKYKDQLNKLDSISIQQHISILTKWLDAKSKEVKNKK